MTGWSYNLQATQTVRSYALNDEDKRELLEMLGLVRPGTRLLAHDGPLSRQVDGMDGEGFDRTPGAADGKITDRPRVSTAPPGLRDYVPTPGPVGPVRRPPRTLTEELEQLEADDPEVAAAADSLERAKEWILSRPLPEPVNVPDPSPLPEHGTPEGARALHHGQALCVRCQTAVDRQQTITEGAARNTDGRRGPYKPRKAPSKPRKTAKPGKAPERKPPTVTDRCGKPGGYDRHRRQGEEACPACKVVSAARQRKWVEDRKAQGRPVQKKRSPRKKATPAPPTAPANTAPAATAPANREPAPEPIPLRPPGAARTNGLDDVRRAADLAAAALDHLRIALDDLAREEHRARITPPTTAGAQP